MHQHKSNVYVYVFQGVRKLNTCVKKIYSHRYVKNFKFMTSELKILL